MSTDRTTTGTQKKEGGGNKYINIATELRQEMERAKQKLLSKRFVTKEAPVESKFAMNR
jgi:hypothetical protein